MGSDLTREDLERMRANAGMRPPPYPEAQRSRFAIEAARAYRDDVPRLIALVEELAYHVVEHSNHHAVAGGMAAPCPCSTCTQARALLPDGGGE